MSTARHISEAERATGYQAVNLPGLTGIADAIRSKRKGELRAYLDAQAHRISEQGVRFILELIGSRADPAQVKARAQAKADRKAAQDKAAQIKAHADKASELARVPIRTLKERLFAQADSWSHRPHYALDSLIADLVKVHRHARGKRIKAACWQHLKALRAYKESGAIHRAAKRGEVRQALSTLRRIKAGDYSQAGRPGGRLPWALPRTAETLAKAGGRLQEGAHMPRAIRERLERQTRLASAWATRIRERERRERERRERLGNLGRNLGRVTLARRTARELMAGNLQGSGWPWISGRANLSAMLGNLACGARDAAQGLRDLGRFPDKAAALDALARSIDSELPRVMERERQEQEERERERERIRNLERPERLELWRTGAISTRELCPGDSSLSAPLLRCLDARVDGCQVQGGTLETSEGATVGLRSAFRVFMAAKHCRETGTAWRSGTRSNGLPARLQAGHFTLDRIDSTGAFKAGCHVIQWEEIQALAKRLDLFDCAPDLETVSDTLESA